MGLIKVQFIKAPSPRTGLVAPLQQATPTTLAALIEPDLIIAGSGSGRQCCCGCASCKNGMASSYNLLASGITQGFGSTCTGCLNNGSISIALEGTGLSVLAGGCGVCNGGFVISPSPGAAGTGPFTTNDNCMANWVSSECYLYQAFPGNACSGTPMDPNGACAEFFGVCVGGWYLFALPTKYVLMFGVVYLAAPYPLLLDFFSAIDKPNPDDCVNLSLTFPNQISNGCGWNTTPLLAQGGYFATGNGGSAILQAA